MPPAARQTSQPGKPALQARSAQTLERILSAAEELLVEREFDQLSVAEIASKAGCAVGTVYGRVADKEDLLFCLHERYMARAAERAGAMYGGLGDAGLEARIEALCDLMVDLIHDHRGVVWAMTNRLYASPSQSTNENMSDLRRDATSMFRFAAAFLAECMPGGATAENQVACEFALLAAHDVTQSRIVYGSRSGLALQYGQQELKARTTELILRYLTAPPRAENLESSDA
ncbi:MAG: TetR/AcrR family transcriptional regulator [Planctomycetota bacterium]